MGWLGPEGLQGTFSFQHPCTRPLLQSLREVRLFPSCTYTQAASYTLIASFLEAHPCPFQVGNYTCLSQAAFPDCSRPVGWPKP